MAISAAVDHPASKRKAVGLPAVIPQIGGQSYYFLWSLERVCMAMGLETLNGKDWYEWGSEILIVNQKPTGAWEGEYTQYHADTCFALLFLKRANFVRDLRPQLKGKLKDEIVLRGGISGEGLKGLTVGSEKIKEPGGDKSGEPKETRPSATNKESERLAREVVEARPERHEDLLKVLRDGKGTQYTEALAASIPQLSGRSKRQAREFLADRLSRLTPERRAAYLEAEDVELRRAAALGSALSENKAHVPQLIGLLRDREPLVARAAWAALKELTGQNFGPSADATDAEKDKAIDAWREWWKKNGK